jgi:hypothetical protein
MRSLSLLPHLPRFARTPLAEGQCKGVLRGALLTLALFTVHPAAAGELPPVLRESDGPWLAIASPAPGMRFTAPASLRLYASAWDPSSDAFGMPTAVDFFLNGNPAGHAERDPNRVGLFSVQVTGLAAGPYVVTAIESTVDGRAIPSFPVPIEVDPPVPSSGAVFSLSQDVVVAGSDVLTLAGTAANRCQILGNGFQIRSAAGWSGTLTVANCDVRGLGSASTNAIDVTVNGNGAITLDNNVFDTSGAVAVAANDTSQLAVRGNLFQENTLVPVSTQPIGSGSPDATLPVFIGSGNSSAPKIFAGNNVGLSAALFINTRNWRIGGDTDAESNVLIGVRCGLHVSNSTGRVLRGNYSYHNYPLGFSQGQNFELFQSPGILVEHNVVRGSAWPVRGLDGTLRYNLVDSHQAHAHVQAPASNAQVHHNLFTLTKQQFLYAPEASAALLYNVDGVDFHNNTWDGGGQTMEWYGAVLAVTPGSFVASLRNNIFANFALLTGFPVVAGSFGESLNPPPQRLRSADYNLFFNPQAQSPVNYGLAVVGKSPGSAGFGLHDLGGFGQQLDPQLAQPGHLPYPIADAEVWNRTLKVSDVLAYFRRLYAPRPGSPVSGAGDPADGTGVNVGAVGNGDPADQFGKFAGGGPPAPPLAPSALAATLLQPTAARLAWTDNSDDEIGFWIERRTVATSFAPIAFVGANGTTFLDSKLTAGISYTYRVRATNAAGDSPNSNEATTAPPPGLTFFTVPPCRVADTRQANGPYGGPPLPGGATRAVVMVGHCSVPSTAVAVALNVTAIAPTIAQALALYPGGTSLPGISTLNVAAGETRANNALLALGAAGDLAVTSLASGGTTDFVLDVTGYFE